MSNFRTAALFSIFPANWRQWFRAAICGLALALAGMPVHAQDRNFVLGGVSGSSNGYYTYFGAGTHFGGALDEPGFMFRGDAGYGDFTYRNVPGASDNVRVRQLDLMPGYQFVTGATHVIFYLGVNDLHDHFDLSPPSLANADHLGAKGQVEIYTQAGATSLLGVASYSTAQHSYFVLGKADEALSGIFSAGPQMQVDGSDLYHAWRVGGHVGITVFRGTSLMLSAGYENSSGARNGLYGALDLWASF